MNINTKSITRLVAIVGLFLGLAGSAALAQQTAPVQKLDNAGCLKCHEMGKEKIEVDAAEGEKRTLRAVDPQKASHGVHSKMQCVDCHRNIVDNEAPHKKTDAPKADCGACHEALWAQAQKEGKAQERPRLETVAKNAQAYRNSFHARKNKDDPTRPNANCGDCHDTHYFNVPADRKSPEYAQWRLGIPALCGESCHEEQLETYTESVHGQEVIEKKSTKGAVCTDCHTTHEITGSSLQAFKLLLPEECGECHKANLRTYRDTYHGQVTKLGDTHTAKCFDCHGSHDIKKVEDKESTVHPDNRLKTCKSCHDGKKATLATAGFVSFGPHAHSNDPKRYPEMWIASRFMIALLLGVFAFFWLHSGLWYYREWKDRKAGKPRQHVRTADLQLGDEHHVHVKRFGLGWRILHLIFALTTMTLVLTGMTALYAGSDWAPVVARSMGGARGLALTHRVAAALFIGIFFIHFLYVMFHLLVRRRGKFKWFGPDSLIPRWQDFYDVWAMFKWFVGKGPRPAFDRWAYYEKFDYWAVFWGVSVIGFSGLMLAFPHITASFLPGWVFNVATLVHGEEAFLAAVFLFTVHFFNNHFRPDKLPPPDIVMFTGVQSLEEFRRDHPAHYQRLVQSGELQKHIVEAPSRPMTVGSKVLGLVLIAFGLTLLVLVVTGFISSF